MKVSFFVWLYIPSSCCYTHSIQPAPPNPAPSFMFAASFQWNFLYKDTVLFAPVNQASGWYSARDIAQCWCVSVCAKPMTDQRPALESCRLLLANIKKVGWHSWRCVEKKKEDWQNERHSSGRDEEQRGGGGKESKRYTEQRGCSVCHIRRVASVWNLCSFLCCFQSLTQATIPGPSD